MHEVINRVDVFISEVREAKSFVERFILWPKRWREYLRDHGDITFEWQRFRLDLSEAEDVPDKPGVYTILIEPGIAGHPHCSFLVYVGKAEKQTLKTRFKQYLTSEQKPKARPYIIYLMREYADYLVFCCSELPVGVGADKAEQALQEGYIPPYCRALPATIRRVIGAF